MQSRYGATRRLKQTCVWLFLLSGVALGGCLGDQSSTDAPADQAGTAGLVPHVIVGIPDSGINPYHEVYYRPNATAHPCTYIQDFPCDVEELPLSIGVHDSYEAAYEADKALFEGMKLGKWYWIPQTVFVGVMCEGSTNAFSALDSANVCLIDDTSMHGTGTTSSVLSENPDALLVFKEGNSATEVLTDGYLPIDIISYSWGAAVPLILPGFSQKYDPFFVAASGNEGAFPVALDATKADVSVINIGAADGASRTEPGYSGWKTMDFVSEYCRPTAQTQSLDETRESYCGTSFSAPTFAGALSRVIWELRQQSGYLGSVINGSVDPILGISKWDVRNAINATASFTPDSPFEADPHTVPLAEQAPFYQWGWGYYARNEVPATMACLLEGECPTRDAATVQYMDSLWQWRSNYAIDLSEGIPI